MTAFFVMHYVCIIHSEKLNRFYTGETVDVEIRLTQHQVGFFKNSSTSRASDWIVFLKIECDDRAHARRLESFIKRQKSSKFIKRLAEDIVLRKEIVIKCR